MTKSRIAVVGTGRAGRARLADLESRPELDGIALSARDPDFDRRFHEILIDPTILGVVISTGNERHYDLAHASLQAGKHTLVEFPLCRTAEGARTLFELSSHKKCVLHVEFIGLMTAHHCAASEQLSDSVSRVHVEMAGGYYRWIKSDVEAGFLGTLLVGRLQALHQLFGTLHLENMTLSLGQDGYLVDLRLSSSSGVHITMRDQRGQTVDRKREICFFDASDAPIEPKTEAQPRSLFAADLDVFLNKVQDVPVEWALPSQDDILAVMDLADRISEQCAQTLRKMPNK